MKIALGLLIILSAVSAISCATSAKRSGSRHIIQEELLQIRESVNRGGLAQAVRDLSMLLEMDPKNKEARFLRAVAYQKRGQYKKAIHDYNLLLKYHPHHHKAHYNLAMIYAFKTYDKETSLKHFDHFLTLEPNHPQAFSVAKIMCALDRESGAKKTRDVSPGKQIDRFFAKQGLREAMEEADPGKRKEMLLEVVRLDPRRPQAYFILAQISEQEGKDSEATKYYKQALEHSPTFAQGHYQLGQLLLKKKRQREGQVHLIKASLFRTQTAP